MKRFCFTIFLCLVFTGSYAQDQAQLYPGEKAFIVKLEMIKHLFWAGEGGYVLEPEFSYHNKRLVYNFIAGMSKVQEMLYDELDYENKGRYLQAGMEYHLSGKNAPVTNGFFIGFDLTVADFEETGSVLFEGDYFDDYEAVLTQDNLSTAFSWSISSKTVLGKHLALDATLRLSRIIGDFDQPEFPVYYVPGAGMTNFLGSARSNHRTTGGISIKIGYKF